jgi:cytochrome c556
MQRKWLTLAAAMVSVSALVAGISLADEEEGPLHQLMEKVSKSGNAIKKAYRTDVSFKKAQASKEIAKQSAELIKLGKEAGTLAKDAVKKAKDPKATEPKWAELNAAFIKEIEKFHAAAKKATWKREEAKSAWGVVNQSCTDCHNVFRVESDSF